MSIGARYQWCVREHMGRYLTTLLLNSYDTPSFEELSKLFETHFEKGKLPNVKLKIIIDLFERMNERLYHFLELSKLAFHSDYFQVDYYLSRKSATLFFEMLCSDFPLHQFEVPYFVDLMSQVILFNKVSDTKIIACCDLLQNLAMYLRDSIMIEAEKRELCKQCGANEECLCKTLEKTLGGNFDVVD
ncbi:MAG: hypothetical protein AAGJ80_15980 [Cyanobacteria bacterium J06553_1]